jgi:hypothetical protein
MTHALRSLLLGLIFLAISGVSIAQAPKTEAAATNVGDKTAADKTAADKTAADKAAADKAAADRAAADKATADKARADKAAADKATADKAAADRAAAASNPLSLNNDQIYQKSLAALTMAFVIAVLLENAFSVIFNWRVFLVYFSLAGVKTIIMIAISLLIVNAFGIDVMASLIAAYKSPPPPGAPIDPDFISGFVSRFVTALILAGGSTGVNRIMVALGFRSNSREEEVAPRPPNNKAWVAVLVTRERAVSEAVVMIKEIGAADANSPSPIAGVVGFKRAGLGSLIFRSTNRFPPNGGYTVSPNVVYSIRVEAEDAQGKTLSALDSQTYVFAPGAIVDFAVKL